MTGSGFKATLTTSQEAASGASEHVLVTAWRQCADDLEPYNPGAANAFRHCADDLEATLRSAAIGELTLAEAAELSGYSVDHLARLVRDGKIPNAGRPRAPRIRRGDLPRRAGTLPQPAPVAMVGVSRRQIARAVVNSEQGAHDD